MADDAVRIEKLQVTAQHTANLLFKMDEQDTWVTTLPSPPRF
jgi:hypothetical protein